ncbi:MAG: hypothetical protein F4179_13785 [Gammaproteobacteria bacterium]|nr:hypothetical protein [Gammaproteobacteria bacterium]
MEDWKAKVHDEEVFCPFCGHTADSTEWNSEEQIDHMKQMAIAHLRSTMGDASSVTLIAGTDANRGTASSP